jgi:hypothetical protein
MMLCMSFLLGYPSAGPKRRDSVSITPTQQLASHGEVDEMKTNFQSASQEKDRCIPMN